MICVTIRRRLVCLFLAPLVLCTPVARAVSTYTIVPLGLDDAEHTRNDGYRVSKALELNEAGQVSGTSEGYSGSTSLGQSAWYFNGMSTVAIGLTGEEHTSDSGKKYSEVQYPYLNETGQVTGSSWRFSGDDVSGLSAWLFNGTNTVEIGLTAPEHIGSYGHKFSDAWFLNQAGQASGRSWGAAPGSESAWFFNGTSTSDIGLIGAEHTRSDGRRYGEVWEMNEAGQVSGHSDRYSGSTQLGQSAWLFNGTSTIDIGLTGAEFTRSNGFKHSELFDLNESGQVAGQSKRYSGSTDFGQSAWFFNGMSTIEVGLTGPGYIRSDGYRLSSFPDLNEAGQIAGHTSRYSGSTSKGVSAWFYDGMSTIEIGLTDVEHTRNDGFRSSTIGQLYGTGNVTGTSQRYIGSTSAGISAWFFDGSSTIKIGLTDAEHTWHNGSKASTPYLWNGAGHVTGHSNRYSGINQLGQSAWFFDGSRTIHIGLTDAQHTRNTGQKESSGVRLNEAGQVTGYSSRYNGAALVGQSAWLYDVVLDQTFPLILSTRSDGYALRNT